LGAAAWNHRGCDLGPPALLCDSATLRLCCRCLRPPHKRVESLGHNSLHSRPLTSALSLLHQHL
jgi:hypothetical protein